MIQSQSVKELNEGRPTGAIPLPAELKRVEDIWWFAPGREADASIGAQIKGVRKTMSGWVYDEWWYFKRVVHPADSPQEEDKSYWYRKKRIPSDTDPDEFDVIEEYVGVELKNPDTESLIQIPEELLKSY